MLLAAGGLQLFGMHGTGKCNGYVAAVRLLGLTWARKHPARRTMIELNSSRHRGAPMGLSAALARRAQATLHSKARPFLAAFATLLGTFCREQT